jgi:hypothetical protein
MTKHNYLTHALHDIKKYVIFSKQEFKQIIWVILATALIFSFNKWGTTHFDLERGLANLFISIIFVGIFFYGQIWIKKLVALKLGYDSKYEWSLPGLVSSVVITFVIQGIIPIVFLGHTQLVQNDRKRLGAGYRFAFNHIDHFKMHAISYLFNYLIILLILAPIYLATNSLFAMELIKINLVLIFFSIIPIPKNDGLTLFFASRNLYLVMVFFIILMSLLILWANLFSFIFALILSLILARILVIHTDY